MNGPVPVTDPNGDEEAPLDAGDVPEELAEAARQQLEYPADESDEG